MLTLIKNFLIGLAMLAFAWFGAEYQLETGSNCHALKARGVAVTGYVEGASKRTKAYSTHYWLDVTYPVGFKEHKGSDVVTEEVFGKYVDGISLRILEHSIPIKYLPDNPKVMQIDDPGLPADFYAPGYGLWILIVLMGGYGLWMVYVSAVLRKEDLLG